MQETSFFKVFLGSSKHMCEYGNKINVCSMFSIHVTVCEPSHGGDLFLGVAQCVPTQEEALREHFERRFVLHANRTAYWANLLQD